MQYRKLLYPFSLLYAGIIHVRNLCFDLGILPSQKYDTPIISVGNISVGGTGKTPLSEYIIRLLNTDYRIALLSRGYKRQTKGALLSNTNSTAASIGDEPYQIKQKFKNIDVVVAEKRVEGMELILNKTTSDLVLMDDAFQHRYVTPGLSILVIDYNRPMWNDCVFPAGNLREPVKGQKRADVIVVNKCPLNLSEEDKQQWLKKLKKTASQHVFFTTITYGNPQNVSSNIELIEGQQLSVVGMAGIAQPQPFMDYVGENFKIKSKIIFPDHHHFNPKDIASITKQAMDDNIQALITTEKDAVRFEDFSEEVKARTYFIPIELKVLFSEEKQFEKIIRNYVRNNSNNS